MYAYVDDSGDSGFKFSRGSTRYIVIASCLFNNLDDISETWKLMESVRCNQQNGKIFRKYDREFKYNKTKSVLKDSFFEALSEARYSVRAIIIDKTKLYDPAIHAAPGSLKSFMIKQLFTHTFNRVNHCDLYIDGHDTRAFAIPDEEYLLTEVNGHIPHTLNSVHFVDSKDNPMIQVADMTAGAIHSMLESDNNDAKRHCASFAERMAFPHGTYWMYTKE